MKNIVAFVFFAVIVHDLGYCASTYSEDKACTKVIRSVEKFVAPAKHRDEYYCTFQAKPKDYLVFRVNSRYPTPVDAGPDWVGSNLMGYFAVSLSNSRVYSWDIAEGRLGLELQATRPASIPGHG